MRLMKLLNATAMALALAAGAAGAAERLTEAGASLPARALHDGAPLEVAIDAAGDEVLSVHALLRPASSNIVLMRDRDGFWVEWSGDRADLAESAARRDGDLLVYKLFQAPPDGVNAMTITLAYRTAEGIKYGWFDAARAATGTE